MSYCVVYGNYDNVGLIESFIRWSNCNCRVLCKCKAQFYAILSLNDTENVRTNQLEEIRKPTFIKQMTNRHEVLAVPIMDLVSLCVCMQIDNKLFCCAPVNTIEAE